MTVDLGPSMRRDRMEERDVRFEVVSGFGKVFRAERGERRVRLGIETQGEDQWSSRHHLPLSVWPLLAGRTSVNHWVSTEVACQSTIDISRSHSGNGRMTSRQLISERAPLRVCMSDDYRSRYAG